MKRSKISMVAAFVLAIGGAAISQTNITGANSEIHYKTVPQGTPVCQERTCQELGAQPCTQLFIQPNCQGAKYTGVLRYND